MGFSRLDVMKTKRYTQRYLSGNGEVWVEFSCIICISGLLFLCEISSYVHSSIWSGPVYWVECMILNIWAKVVEKELCCGKAVDLKLSEIFGLLRKICTSVMTAFPQMWQTYCFGRCFLTRDWQQHTVTLEGITYSDGITQQHRYS